jgi:hypothetical protein
MHVPAFYNLPFRLLGAAFFVTSAVARSCFSIGASFYVARQIEANHCGAMMESVVLWEGNNPPLQRVGRATLWHRVERFIPAPKSLLYGFLYCCFVLELRSAGGVLPLDSSLVKFAVGEGFFMVTDAMVATRFLFQPRKAPDQTNYSLPWRPNASPSEQTFAVIYFGTRIYDGVCRIWLPANTVAMIPVLLELARVGILASWCAVELSLKVARISP